MASQHLCRLLTVRRRSDGPFSPLSCNTALLVLLPVDCPVLLPSRLHAALGFSCPAQPTKISLPLASFIHTLQVIPSLQISDSTHIHCSNSLNSIAPCSIVEMAAAVQAMSLSSCNTFAVASSSQILRSSRPVAFTPLPVRRGALDVTLDSMRHQILDPRQMHLCRSEFQMNP